ncbi:hypothetical protein VMCG_04557 [Cytospora schulzeri]|uniref:Uncharacterized protein n=1 Tax=Cytospora schulzeri TaxID=448051 RepID=A0A423WSE3_9PEZI|nr:hypothetical protein VMCG_04557 [Valsa malicola]
MKLPTTTTTLLLPALGLLQLLSCPAPVRALPNHQFDDFFPGWNGMIQDILRYNCSAPYSYYLAGETGPSGQVYMVFEVIECVLQQFPEFRKSEMAGSAVILGLLPSTLQNLGSTSAETSLLGLRRPVLALLCAIGSPAVRRMTGGGFLKTISKVMVKARHDEASVFVMPGLSSTRIPAMYWLWVSILEYILVGGAVANVISLTYQLGVHAVVVFSPKTLILLPLWTALAVVIHVGGVIALYMRSPKIWEWRKENIWFQVTTWMLSIGTVAHTVFGTLIMSSLLFFSVADSVTIVARTDTIHRDVPRAQLQRQVPAQVEDARLARRVPKRGLAPQRADAQPRHRGRDDDPARVLDGGALLQQGREQPDGVEDGPHVQVHDFREGAVRVRVEGLAPRGPRVGEEYVHVARVLPDAVQEGLDTLDGAAVRGDGDGLGAGGEVGQGVEELDCVLAGLGLAGGDEDFGAACLEESR